MTAQICIAAFVGVAAIIDDLARRRVANWIPAVAFVAGLVLQSVQHGWRGAGSALLGTATGAAVFMIFYLLGGMGGGDVKLMAGFGAVLGAIEAAAGEGGQKARRTDSIPYAPAIAAGVWLSLVPKT